MTLWEWSGAVWAKPGVSTACLALQDDHDQCVPLLLWTAWRWENGEDPDDAAVGRAVALCRTATQSVIEPLRSARRLAVSPHRERLLDDELHAERKLLDGLEDSPTHLPHRRGRTSPAVSLSDMSVLWGHPLTPSAFDDFLAALDREPADVR